jgi:hypothetical protein
MHAKAAAILQPLNKLCSYWPSNPNNLLGVTGL